MTYVYEPAAYGPQPNANGFWPTTEPVPLLPTLLGDVQTDVAIIGAGFTGLSAAYHLARAGVRVVVVDAQFPTFGATGRNGGFCCLGGGKITNRQLENRYGADERKLYRQTEKGAVQFVADLIRDLGINADTHSQGETLMAHDPKRAVSFYADQMMAEQDYGVTATIHSQQDLRDLGMAANFHGGMTTPIGFALNPRKYALGLMRAAMEQGAAVYAHSPVTQITPTPQGYTLSCPSGQVTARRFILAANGYASETLPPWMKSRFLPVQSSVIVTEPISETVQQKQGWTSAQMSYDTRFLLHYFRLMPNGRFLFGMRGGLRFTPRADRKIRALIRKNFNMLFPEWRNVGVDHYWSGLVALNRNLAPYVGPIPGYPGGFTGFAYHGNGVAMASYAGGLLADLAQDKTPQHPYPAAFRQEPDRYPLGRHRRWLLEPIYRLMPMYEK